MLFVTTLDFCLPSTGHLWPHWHHWPKIFNSTSCFRWQHYIVTLSPDVSQYFVACAFILSYLRNPLPLDTWTRGQQTLALQSCPAGIRVAWWVLRALRPRDHLHQKQYVEMGILEECVAFDLAILGTGLQVWNSKTILAKPFSVFNLAVSQTFLGYHNHRHLEAEQKNLPPDVLSRLVACSAENLRLRQHLGRDIHQ